jgi:phage terminase small subunit
MTEKQRLYCDNLLILNNSVEAARRAGYSEQSALKASHNWIRETREASLYPEMFDYVQKRREKLSKSYEVTQDRLVAELAKIAFTDVKDLYNEDGSLLDIKDLPAAAAGAIGGIEYQKLPGKKQGVLHKIKQLNKIDAIKTLNQMLGFNAPEKVEVESNVSFLDLLKQTSVPKTAKRSGKKQARKKRGRR